VKKFIVTIQETYYIDYEVEATSEAGARDIVADGGGERLASDDPQYWRGPDCNDPDEWPVRKK